MDIRGRHPAVSYARVVEEIRRVSEERYGGNLLIHPDAKPLGVNGYGFQGRIIGGETDGPGTRRSQSGLGTQRRGKSACWHAYRDAIGSVFRVYPAAVVKSGYYGPTVYRGIDGFREVFPGTARVNIGSEFCPAYMPDLCDCEVLICGFPGCGYFDGPATDETGRCWQHIRTEGE